MTDTLIWHFQVSAPLEGEEQGIREERTGPGSDEGSLSFESSWLFPGWLHDDTAKVPVCVLGTFFHMFRHQISKKTRVWVPWGKLGTQFAYLFGSGIALCV